MIASFIQLLGSFAFRCLPIAGVTPERLDRYLPALTLPVSDVIFLAPLTPMLVGVHLSSPVSVVSEQITGISPVEENGSEQWVDL